MDWAVKHSAPTPPPPRPACGSGDSLSDAQKRRRCRSSRRRRSCQTRARRLWTPRARSPRGLVRLAWQELAGRHLESTRSPSGAGTSPCPGAPGGGEGCSDPPAVHGCAAAPASWSGFPTRLLGRDLSELLRLRAYTAHGRRLHSAGHPRSPRPPARLPCGATQKDVCNFSSPLSPSRSAHRRVKSDAPSRRGICHPRGSRGGHV